MKSFKQKSIGIRDQDTRSEMAIIVVINELNIGAVTGPATRQVAQPLFLPGIDTQHRYAAGTGLAAQGSDQSELPVAFMWIDVTGTQRLAQGTTPIAGPRQRNLARNGVISSHRRRERQIFYSLRSVRTNRARVRATVQRRRLACHLRLCPLRLCGSNDQRRFNPDLGYGNRYPHTAPRP